MTIVTPTATEPSFAMEAAGELPALIALRRKLHTMPEIGLDLPQTQEAVLRALDGLDLEITLGKNLSSVVAVLRGAKPGDTVLLRGDMDALPIEEETELAFASSNGSMHACGHDLHTAGLVGAARLLHAHRHQLRGNVIFMFQPGEEGPGGAGVMLEEGLLEITGELPVAAYGIHVVPGEKGVFTTRPGTVMAGSNILSITVRGRGGHGSEPTQALDPVPVVAEIVLALQSFVTRRFQVDDPIVISVTQMAAGSAVNVIPDSASLGATVRTRSHASLNRLRTELPVLARAIAQAHGCTVEVDFEVLYPVTINDEQETIRSVETLRDLFGDERIVPMEHPMMGAEDFSLVLERVPGTFIMLKASPQDINPETAAFNHSSRVLFDDSVLGDQAAALAQLAWSRLMAPDEAG